MKTKCLTCLLMGFLVVSIASTARAQIAGYYSTTNPGTTKPPASPWQNASGGYPMPTGVGESVWLAKLNGWVHDDVVKSYALRIQGPEPQKYGIAGVTGYIDSDGPLHTSSMAAVTGIKDIPGPPPAREFTITIKPQPDWEVFELQRTQAFREGPRDDYEAEHHHTCGWLSLGESGFDMYEAWFGTSGDSTRTTQIVIFADDGEVVDDSEAHSLTAPGGPWSASMVYVDRDGTARTGVQWTTTGEGLYAEDVYSLHVELMSSPEQHDTFSYYAWDDERARWVFYKVLIPPETPTVSEWGMVVLVLLLLTAVTIVVGRRRRVL